MIKTAVAGATGYTGAELVKLITGHPDAELTSVTSRSYGGKNIADIFPSMRGVVDITCQDMNPDELKGKVDCVFLALPHKISMGYAPLFLENGIKVIDLSADFRFKSLETYEKTYQKHSAPDLLKHSVYGLSEIYRDEIQKADLVGNPGCYPTSLLLPIIPLVRDGLVRTEGIISDSKSGVSGAGRSLSLTSHYCEVTESFKAYKVGSHRHVPEMEEILTAHAPDKNAGAETAIQGNDKMEAEIQGNDKVEAEIQDHHRLKPAIAENDKVAFGTSDGNVNNIKITFVPHLLPMSRGMLTTIYAGISDNATENSIRETLADTYRNNFFVRILPEGMFPDTAHVRGTNFCDIGLWVDESSKRIIIISAIDNILKGAAGQAVQNMNLMFGLDEATGLKIIPGAI
ncbi:N-acetyl-gamma-glutamyl-phosphate reductase [Desulfamplus magnetovallimortis]|uniref:N-acetyl-gamma-glutamyl-phosphate reductase n=1 Tax=Desulfamplus magnetovallimortis TaxID=1246637 RepID=A0A1W1H9Q0_9BACT|nr:N-acetyl-gamma-glutamyl-phosphate reductase [Desulfamplus magnetovallimortis]SLM29135.1 N-acetyl-gamma-glutamyl-phosphate reductase [Desulfamplus magnetovallimortis]